MADRKDIITTPNPQLRQVSARINRVDSKVKNLIKDMKAVGLDWERHRPHEICVGLAAVQIGKLMRVVIVRDREATEAVFKVLINPRVIKTYGELQVDFEGCLSVKDIYGTVPRYRKVKYQYLDEDGKKQTDIAEDFDAVIVQHEADHTKGILFIDRIEDDKDAFHYINEEGTIAKADYEQVKASGIFR